MFAALFNEIPNFGVFMVFSLFCACSIFMWVSRLPAKLPVHKGTWGLQVSWLDFGLFIFMCFLAAYLTGMIMGMILAKTDLSTEMETMISQSMMPLAILGTILAMRKKFPAMYGEPMNQPQAASNKESILHAVYSFLKFIPLIWMAALVSQLLLSGLGIEPKSQDLVELFMETKNPLVLAGLILGAVVLAPLMEETLFRGYLYRFFRGKWNVLPANMASSFFFAAIHGNAGALFPLFVLSIFMTHTYEKTGNLMTPILYHSMFNGLTLLVLLNVEKLPEVNF